MKHAEENNTSLVNNNDTDYLWDFIKSVGEKLKNPKKS